MYSFIKNFIKKNDSFYTLFLIFKLNFFRLMHALITDEFFCKCRYYLKFKKPLNLQNPISFNEKLQWLKLRWNNDICTICVDKYEVRALVKERIGEKYLTKLYQLYNKTEEIDIQKLPNSFVIKTTHGSGQNILCKDKADIIWTKAIKHLPLYLKFNYYYYCREWAYKNVPPRLICEEYLEENGAPPRDYKFFCFNGTPKFVQVDLDRFTHHTRNMYDMNWNLLNFTFEYAAFIGVLHKPETFELMTELAAKLSQGLPFVRVDLYSIGQRVVFGELTFYPEGGFGRFNPDLTDQEIGSYFQLPVS